ncbi:hypothetical protein [Mycobacterium colombiense]|uniref:hypothetical protein n=1 Tax=Mycobacterium colombiense TaxID=339268 RepID=UPI00096E9FA0|nr:hypothetical protein [Mycobacterium colombiense]OMB93216.1 hypothetical protein A5732_16835 [Mycobacterium colombiense]
MTDETFRLGREDASLVVAAANDGRITSDSVPQWLMAMRADRAGTRKTLASLTSVRANLLNTSDDVVSGADHAERGVMASLARLGIQPTSRKVAASGAPAPAGYAAPGLPSAREILWGKPFDQWTQEERDDATQWQLGPRFRQGLKPPPGGVSYYIPSGDPSTVEVPDHRLDDRR